jgi:hypothetical protein
MTLFASLFLWFHWCLELGNQKKQQQEGLADKIITIWATVTKIRKKHEKILNALDIYVKDSVLQKSARIGVSTCRYLVSNKTRTTFFPRLAPLIGSNLHPVNSNYPLSPTTFQILSVQLLHNQHSITRIHFFWWIFNWLMLAIFKN